MLTIWMALLELPRKLFLQAKILRTNLRFQRPSQEHSGQRSSQFNSLMILLTSCRYHSHSELQRADGFYGGLVIHKRFEKGLSEFDEYEYEDETILLIGDWYHRSAVDVQAGYLTSRSSGHEVGEFAPAPPSTTLTNISLSQTHFL